MNKKTPRLPSVGTIYDMNLQRLALSCKQIRDVVADKPDTSLYTDETFIHWWNQPACGYHVRDQQCKYFTLRLRDLTTKSASDTLKTLTEILADTLQASKISENEASRRSFTNISASMLDSTSTEVKFNNLLGEYRVVIPLYT